MFQYKGEKESYSVCEWVLVMATANIKEKNIYNTMEFVIEKINNYGEIMCSNRTTSDLMRNIFLNLLFNCI